MSADAFARRGTGGGWKLTEGAFGRLLEALDSDRERAAVAYELLRQRMIGLLQWWGAAAPEDLADATLDRVARKLEEGAVIAQGSLGAYARGVARMIFYEAGREPRGPAPELPPPGDAEASLACLDRCLGELRSEERSLVLSYYGEGHKADLRRRLASREGLSATALRIRVHRLRERLERCVTACRAQP